MKIKFLCYMVLLILGTGIYAGKTNKKKSSRARVGDKENVPPDVKNVKMGVSNLVRSKTYLNLAPLSSEKKRKANHKTSEKRCDLSCSNYLHGGCEKHNKK